MVRNYWIVAFVATLTRALSIFDWNKSLYQKHLLIDANDHAEKAQAIRDGLWVGRDAFYASPLYPYLLALTGNTAMIALQFVLGVLTCLILANVTSKYFGERAGLFAGLLAALYAPFIFFTPTLLKETVSIFSFALLLFALAHAHLKISWKRVLLLGLTLGLCALSRGTVLLMAPLFVFYFGPKWKSYLVIFLVGIFLPIAPFTLHNWMAKKDFVLINYSGGFNFYLGNYEKASGINVTPEGVSSDMTREAKDITRVAEIETGRNLLPSEVSAVWTKKALRYIWNNPIDWVQLEFRKLLIAINNYEEPDNYDQQFYWDNFSSVVTSAYANFALLFALAGMGIYFYFKKQLSRAPFVVLSAGYLATLLIYYINDRFRLPLALFLIPLAGLGFAQFDRKNFRAIGIAVVLFVVSIVPQLQQESVNRATAWGHIASINYKEKNFEESIKAYEKALQENHLATPPHAIIAAAQSYAHLQQLTNAESVYLEGLKIWPNSSVILNSYGVYFLQTSRPEMGIRVLKHAAEVDPVSNTAYKNLYIYYSRHGQTKEAEEMKKIILSADPFDTDFLTRGLSN